MYIYLMYMYVAKICNVYIICFTSCDIIKMYSHNYIKAKSNINVKIYVNIYYIVRHKKSSIEINL